MTKNLIEKDLKKIGEQKTNPKTIQDIADKYGVRYKTVLDIADKIYPKKRIASKQDRKKNPYLSSDSIIYSNNSNNKFFDINNWKKREPSTNNRNKEIDEELKKINSQMEKNNRQAMSLSTVNKKLALDKLFENEELSIKYNKLLKEKFENKNSGVNKAVSRRNQTNMSKPVSVRQHTRKNTTGVRKHTRNKAKQRKY